MDWERDFLDELDVDLGQRRSRDTLALYLKGLRTCKGKRSLTNIAAAVADSAEAPSKLVERFNYQLNDRQGRRNGRDWWAPAMMRALAERTAKRLSSDRPQVLVLATMFAPHLGRSVLHQNDIDSGTAQVVASLLLVGFGPTGELEAQPIGWRLAFDNWDDAAFARSDVPPTVRHRDHVSVPAGAMLTDIARWRIPRLPIVAGTPFADLRYHWLAAGWSYVVASQEPNGVSPAAVSSATAPSPIETLRQDIEQPDDNWRNVLRERAPESTSRALTAHRTDLMTKWRTVESAIEIGENVWRAHLPDVPDNDKVNQALDYDSLGQNASPIYRTTLRDLGLDDYRGRCFAGWHAHRALVSAAHLMNRETTWDAARSAPHQT